MEISDCQLIRLLKIAIELAQAEPNENIKALIEKTIIENRKTLKIPIEEMVPAELHRECVYKSSLLEGEILLLKKQIEDLVKQMCYPKFKIEITEEPCNFKRSIYSKLELPVKDLEICEKHVISMTPHDTEEYVRYIVEQQLKNISQEYGKRGYRYWIEKREEH
jgi:hypothetical protein